MFMIIKKKKTQTNNKQTNKKRRGGGGAQVTQKVKKRLHLYLIFQLEGLPKLVLSSLVQLSSSSGVTVAKYEEQKKRRRNRVSDNIQLQTKVPFTSSAVLIFSRGCELDQRASTIQYSVLWVHSMVVCFRQITAAS